MPRATAIPTVDDVRVIIVFNEAQPWAGSLRLEDGGDTDVPFIGRLDLLRLLEPLTDPDAHTDPAHLKGAEPREQR